MEASPVVEAAPSLIVAEPKKQSADTLSIKASPVSAQYDKFAQLRSKKPIKDERPLTWTEIIMGEEIPTEFETQVDSWLAARGAARPRLGAGSSASKLLDSVDGTMWTGKVAFGSEKEEFNLLFDTASDWTVVDGVECE